MSSSYKSIMPQFGKISLLMIFLFCSYALAAQESADKIIAVIGRNRIILQSDLEMEVLQARQQDPRFNDTMKCIMLQQMVLRKMLLEQAERDSVMVGDEDVEGQLDNRLRYFIQLYGSKEKLEQVSGKTIYQIKEENRDAIREQMVAEKLQGTILENVKITPAEVNDFYKKIPVDSLPFFPATVEVGQIVIDPPVSAEMDDYARQKLAGIRQDIIDGKKTFELAAGFYSEDPGSRDNGGRYDGVTRTGPWAAEFVAAAFKLQNGEISPIIKTKFGYHIIQMIQRKGDEADIRHILIKPEVTSADFKKALTALDSIRTILVSGKMTFQEAVGKFSTDEAAKRTGGMIADPTTGNTELDMTKLDPAMVLMIDSMKVSDYSAPHIFITDAHDKSCRFVYLRSRTTPHKANLKDDYSRIQEVALSQKKQLKMQSWVESKLPTYYLKLAPEYQACSGLKDWRTSTDSVK
ncbi:MAG: peptidylprolyl isomerase [Chitinophagales bacterium]